MLYAGIADEDVVSWTTDVGRLQMLDMRSRRMVCDNKVVGDRDAEEVSGELRQVMQ